MKTTQFRNDN